MSSSRMLRRALLGGVATVGLGLGAAQAAQLGPLTKVSGASPFAGCTADRVAQQEGTNYPATEIEPWVASDPSHPNRLIIGLQPEETIRLTLMAKTPGLGRDGLKLREIPLDLGLANAFSEFRRRIAYERLLLDLIEGDPTLFVRRDEVEAQWTWIDRIRTGWAQARVAPEPYAAGSWGPSAAIALATRDGVTWHE